MRSGKDAKFPRRVYSNNRAQGDCCRAIVVPCLRRSVPGPLRQQRCDGARLLPARRQASVHAADARRRRRPAREGPSAALSVFSKECDRVGQAPPGAASFPVVDPHCFQPADPKGPDADPLQGPAGPGLAGTRPSLFRIESRSHRAAGIAPRGRAAASAPMDVA